MSEIEKQENGIPGVIGAPNKGPMTGAEPLLAFGIPTGENMEVGFYGTPSQMADHRLGIQAQNECLERLDRALRSGIHKMPEGLDRKGRRDFILAVANGKPGLSEGVRLGQRSARSGRR